MNRPFQPTDLDACVDLFVATFAQPPWSETWDRDVAEARLAQIAATPGFVGVVTGEPEITGFALGVSQPWTGGNHFLVQEVCVNWRLQRQGIGTKLMEYLTDRIRERGDKRIYLLTARGDMSETFYTKIGFYTSPRMILMARRLEEESST